MDDGVPENDDGVAGDESDQSEADAADDASAEYVAENRAHWDELAAIHPDTDFYEVDAFLDGESTLEPVEVEELGDVTGTTLLHPQCHFGMDTLSWARRGARVTGVDFSETAVETAHELAELTGLADRARFVESDVYELPGVLDEQFDVVYTSFGVLYWLPDVTRWANVVAQYVRPGGTFYLAEYHPFTNTLDESSTGQDARFVYPYFEHDDPITWEGGGSYADEDAGLEHDRSHGWHHSLGEIVTALCDAGLRVEFLHEFPWTNFAALDTMERGDDGYYRMPELEHELPFVFTLKATNPS